MVIVRNHSIDILKLFCSFLVVFIHCEYPYKSAVLPITDVAVPLFFCVSGYFVFGANITRKRIGRIAKIFAWSSLLYLAKTEVFQLITGHHLYIPPLHSIINFVLFNDVAFSIHLWYLPAYIYVLVIVFFIDRYNLWRISEVEYYRNAYFKGLPYFLIGALMKNLLPPPVHIFKYKKELLMVSVVALSMLRYFLNGRDFVTLAFREINLLLLTICIFILTTNSVLHQETILSRLGKHYSLYIYIFHVLTMSVCEMTANFLPIYFYNDYMVINPLCVFLLTVVFTYILGKLKIIKV